MTKRHNYQNGYIGLLLLLVAVTIVVFLMFKEYEQSGLIKNETDNSVNSKGEVTTQSSTPIERAKDMKGVLEARDRGMLENTRGQ